MEDDLQFRATLLQDEIKKMEAEMAKNNEFVRLFKRRNIELTLRIADNNIEIEILKQTDK